jgi:hypothetical protein
MVIFDDRKDNNVSKVLSLYYYVLFVGRCEGCLKMHREIWKLRKMLK